MADQTFWQTTWARTKQVLRFIAGSLPALIIVIVAVILVFIGVKVSIGGLLTKLFGKAGDEAKKAIDVVNSMPKNRVDKDGKLIPPGQPDSTGQTQAVVVPIEEPGFFDDPNKIKIIPPGETKPLEVTLPDGVRPSDVDKVIVVRPNVHVVVVKDSSGISGKDVDELLRKYGG